MTFDNLQAYIKRLDREGLQSQRYTVDLYSKTAMPFIPFVFAMIGVPLGLHRLFAKGVSRAIGLSLILAGFYWVIFSLCISLGYGEVLPPLLAAWLANGLFTLAGIYLMIESNQ